MPQPYPNPNMTTFTGFFEHVNTITQNLAVPMFCLVTTVVIFIIMKRKEEYENSSCLLVAFSLTLLISLLLWASGLLDGKIVVIYLVLTILSGILNELSRR